MRRRGSPSRSLFDRSHHLLRRVGEVLGRKNRQSGLLQDPLAEIDVGAFEANDERDVQIDLARRGNDTLGDDVAAHDPAEDVDQDPFDVGVAQDQLERRRDPLARGPTADIEKVRRAAAVQFDDVHRRHRQAGAVDHAADIAVELDVVESVPAGLDLGRVLFVLVAQRRDLGMAVERVVVEADLGIEGEELTGLGHDQRVDLGDRGVELAKRPIECRHEFDGNTDLGAFEPNPEGEIARVERLDPARRVDRLGQALLRCMCRDFLDLDPALDRADQGHSLGGAVDQHPEVEFAGDVAALLDIDPLDLAALRPRLMGDQLPTQHRARRSRDFLFRAGELDPAGLAASAGMDLRFDHPGLPAEPAEYATPPRGTATPNFASSSFAWYSWMFIGSAQDLHALDDLDQLADGGGRFVEGRLLLAIERDLDDPLDAAGADHHRDADIEVAYAVLAFEQRRTRQYPLLVAQIGLDHRDRRAGGCVERRSRLQQTDDLGAAVAGALDDLVEPVLGRPSHSDEVGQRDAGDRRVAQQWHHRVAVAAEHKGADILDRDPQLLGKEITEAGAVEHSGHADDTLRRQPAGLAHDPHHDVERVGDGDDESLGAMLLDRCTHRRDDLGVGADQIVAAHPRLARDAGGDDDDIGAGNGSVVVGPRDDRVVALDRRALNDVERLALRHAVDHVEEDDVAELLEPGQQCNGAADLPGPDQRDLVACHANASSWRAPIPSAVRLAS